MWGGQLPALPSHTLTLDDVGPDGAIHLHGKIQATTGTGTLSYTIPRLTAGEQPQLCTTGELTWSVARTVPPVLNPGPQGTPLDVRQVVMTDGTRITLTRYG